MSTINVFSVERSTGVVTADSSTITTTNDLVLISVVFEQATVDVTSLTLANGAMLARLFIGDFAVETARYRILGGVARMEFVLTEDVQRAIADETEATLEIILSEKTGARYTYIYTGGTFEVGGGGGSGDVTAASNFGTDNVLLRSNGTGKGAQATGIAVDDSDNVTGIADLEADSITAPAIAINATHDTDDSYHGLTLTGLLAGATIAQWEAVYVGGSSTFLLADANGSGTYPARGLAVAAYSSTNPATVLVQGTVRNDAWNWTPGGDIYLSATAGGLTQTAPSTSGDKVQKVGFALTADVAFFNFASGEFLTVT